MSWHFSLELVGEYLAAKSLGIESFAPLRETSSPETYCWRDKTIEALSLFQCGTTSQPSTVDHGVELLNWYLEGSLARTCQSRGQCGDAMELLGKDRDLFLKCCESSTKSSQKSYLEKTVQSLEKTELTQYAQSLSQWDIKACGQLLALICSVFLIIEKGCGFFPTPTARDWKDTIGMNPERKDGKTRTDRLPMMLFEHIRTSKDKESFNGLKIIIQGPEYSPELPELIMGWPIGWTEYKPLETDRFRLWLHAYSIFSSNISQ